MAPARRAAALLGVLAGVVAGAAGVPGVAAAAPLSLRPTLSAAPVSPAAGVASPAPTAGAVAGDLTQDTGLTPAQVTRSAVCGPALPGRATCDAQTLRLRSAGGLVHPRPRERPTFTQVFPRRRSLAPAASPPSAATAATPASAATPATPPQAGTPAWLQQAYDLTYLSQTAGANDTVAIVDAGDDPRAESDLTYFRSHYGLPACTSANGCLTKVNQSGQTSPLPATAAPVWLTEESLDLDAVSALCPNCHIVLVESNTTAITDLDAGIAAASGLGADQISNSYGFDATSPSGVSTFPGASVLASTGDSGYAGAGEAQYPAALPSVTAVGGTTLAPSATASTPRGFDESAWSLSGGSGGGSGCDLQEPKPVWQNDTGCSGRSYADVSADANPYTGIAIYNSNAGGWEQMGGTSLAAPLTAAFEAVGGVTGTTPQWAYTDSALLNDPVTGSTGACAAAILYICDAGTGYDGPTGAGSISGAVTTGGPGIGGPAIPAGATHTYAQTVASTTAALTAGVYPNGLDTHAYWQYGTSTAYGAQTSSVDLGAGTQPVAAPATLAGLAPNTTYHYRLVATNADATTYGYDYTLTTNPQTDIAPVNTVAPAVTGPTQQGQTLTSSAGTWSPAPTAVAYQWQRSADGGTTWTDITGATAAGYTVAGGDLGDSLHVVVTATDAYGATTATTAATNPITSGAPVAGATPSIIGNLAQGQVVTVSSTWTPAGSAYAYLWQRSSDGGATWTTIAGATTGAYTLVAADLNADLRVIVTATNAFGQAASTSAGVGPVLADAPLNTAAPVIAGTAQRAATLTATTGSWTGANLAYTFQWQRSADGSTWTAIPGAVASSYMVGVADEGDSVRVMITAANGHGSAGTPSAATAPVAPSPPADTTPPAVAGTPERGATLSATAGSWTGAGNVYSFQWQKDTGEGYVTIAGATAATYQPTVGDEGATVRVVVTAANPDASIVAPSAPTATVTDALPVNQAAPAVTGNAQRGLTLAATPGTWAGLTNVYAYQWQRSADSGTTWTTITGATAATYAVAVADEGDLLRAAVTATNPDGAVTAPSAATAPATGSPPAFTAPPTIVGTPQRGAPLAATPGTWTGNGNVDAYQWQRSPDAVTWTDIAGATRSTYTPAVGDEGDALRVTLTAVNPDTSVTADSAATANVAATPPVNTALPALSGVAQRSQTLVATDGAWSGIGDTWACQWQRSSDGGTTWVAIPGANAFTYTLGTADEGFEIRALVTAANADGSVAAPTAPSAVVVAAAPSNLTSPTIAGTAVRGTLLSSTQGTWAGIGDVLSYQWQRSVDGATWTDIPGATGFTYTLAAADEGDTVRLRITAANPDGTVGAATPPTAMVLAAPPTNSGVPALTGSAQRGVLLSATTGTWTGTANVYGYQWQRSPDGATWTNIAGATGVAYALSVADEGDAVRLQVSATNPDGSATAASAPTALVLATPPVNTVAPSVSGTLARGSTLSTTPGTWTGVANTYAYQWQRSPDGTTWTTIAGQTAGTYSIALADENDRLRVLVTASNADGTVSVPSTASSVVPAQPPVNSVLPQLTGSAQRGLTLTATPGTWAGLSNSYTYAWQRSTDGTTWTTVPGVIATSYTLAVADEGAQVRVIVTATNLDGSGGATSAASAIVTATPPVSAGAPTVSGAAQRGANLTAAPGAWNGVANSFGYQWQSSTDGTTWTPISGATGVTYLPTAGDEGARLRVVVTATNADGSAAAPSAATTAVVASPPVNTTAPSITGPVRRTFGLAATSGAWTGYGNRFAYQWQRSADGGTTWTAIPGATSAAYTLAAADESDIVRVAVTATNPDTAVTAVSGPSPVVGPTPPVSSSLPTISGLPRLGATLSAGLGGWNPGGDTYAFTWQRSADGGTTWTTIPGATAQSYTLAVADVGQTVHAIVTATNVDAAVPAISPATGTVAAPPQNTTAPAAPAGALMDTYTLTPDPGTWDAASTYTYSWLRCASAATSVTPNCIAMGVGPLYGLTAADVGSKIAAIVTATDSGGSTAVDSALTATITGRPLSSLTPPAITGDPQPPATLYAGPGTWSVPLSAITYTWDRCDPDGVSNCSAVASGIDHYRLSGADQNHTIVLVAAAASPGQTATAQSPALTVENAPVPQPTIVPAISGAATRTVTLTASPGLWTNAPTIAYQWQRCDSSGANCVNVPGATIARYTLTTADEGATITVVVTATNGAGTATAAATATAVVAALPPTVARAAQLSVATPAQSVPLSVVDLTWNATPDTSYAIVWKRCDGAGGNCTVIAGATAPAYTPTAADVGHTLIAAETATNPDGSVTSATGASQVVVPAAPRWRDLPMITSSGSAVGGTVSVTPGVWTGPAVTNDVVEVMRCTSACVAVGSAASYTIATADVGAILRVRETASNAGGPTAVWSAQYVGPVTSVASAAAVLTSGQTVLRNSRGQALAVARVGSSATMSRNALRRSGAAVAVGRDRVTGGARASRSGSRPGTRSGSRRAAVREVTIRRARGIRGRLRVWACAAGAPSASGPPPCTRQITIGASGRLALPASLGGRVRVVVVRRGR